MRRTLFFASLASILCVPATSFAYINLTSGGGYLFDFSDISDWDPAGSMSNGSVDAYDGCYTLNVGGSSYDPGSGSVTMTEGGRQLEYPSMVMSGLNVQRIVYVPTSGGDWARYLEILDNPGTTAVMVTVSITGNLGSDGSTNLHATSSGDASLTTADLWFATDDTDGSGDPSLAHVFAGSSSSVTVSSVSLSFDSIEYTWNVTVPPGGRIALMHFAVQTGSRAGSVTEATRLVEAPDDALTGIDDYLDDIQNFGVATPGAPRVRFTGPFEAEEGAEVVLEAMIEDLEGDTYTFSWDLDGDETFGEAAGMTTYTIAAGTTDGPSALRIGVQATDSAGNVAERYRTISITNVAPAIVSDPPLATSVGADFRYPLVVDDPAGERDELTYTVTRGPSRMTISPEGVLQWSPSESDVTLPGDTITIEVQVADDDEGTGTQSWEMVVSPNRQPGPAVPAYPIDMVAIIDTTPRLAAANAEDLDLDELNYFFQIDTVPTFDSPNLRESGAVPETPGYTAWQITDPLTVGTIYYWRVYANDGNLDSATREAAFYVVPDPSMTLTTPDGGVADGGVTDGGGTIPGIDAGVTTSGGGCSASSGSSRGGLALLVLGVIGLVAARRRRR